MPKYYCDYCDTFLTHDSPSVRKTHNNGRKHKDNVRAYYEEFCREHADLYPRMAGMFAPGMGLPGMMGGMPPLGMHLPPPPNMGGMMPPPGFPPPGFPPPGFPPPGMAPPMMPPSSSGPPTSAGGPGGPPSMPPSMPPPRPPPK
eukprot:m.336088 g.336088  ORF g.336088 m.336088 type:complete len:144 (+) comp17752_c0_seq1:113-544(+)